MRREAASRGVVAQWAILTLAMSGCIGGAANNPVPDAQAPFDAGTLLVDAAADAFTVHGEAGGGIDPDSGSIHSATATVPGGTVSRSARYTLIGSVGQSPGGNVTSHSPTYQFNGGVVGGTQKP